MNPTKPHLSFWQIVNMNVGFFGIQFSFGLQQANMSPIYQYLGADEASLEEWARVGKSALGEVRGRLLAEDTDLWTPALHEVWDRLPHYAGVAWETGQAQKPERPQQ